MDSVSQFLQPPMVTLYLLLITCLYVLFAWRKPTSNTKTKADKKPPLAAGAWPILGHLHLLSPRDFPHKVLGVMADKHGPIFRIRVGVHQALVVSNWEVAKECYSTNDKNFASRPRTTGANIMGYDCVMFGFAAYGPYWSEMRRLISSELLSTRRLELLKHVQETEINVSMKELYIASKQNTQVLVDMKQWFNDVTLNIVLMMIAGKRFTGSTNSETDDFESKRCQDAVRDAMKLLGVFMVEDALPYLRWFDLQGYKKEMTAAIKELDSLYQEWLEEHQRRRCLEAGQAKEDQDFMDVLMSTLGDGKNSYHDKDTIIKSTCIALMAGAGDTVMLTLTWMLCLLLNNKETLKKAQQELDKHVGRDRHVKESDIKNLVYLQAIINEGMRLGMAIMPDPTGFYPNPTLMGRMRLYPAAPLAGPRVAIEDCTLAGYHVPAGTGLLVNVWKIHRDPLVWSEPNEFRPERFLTTHLDIDHGKGKHYKLLPFAAGRRACPGISFALQTMPLTLGNLLHGFDLTTPMDMPVDLSELEGVTIVKKTPLQVGIAPRLRPEVYGV
ncbi:hypothetical protein ACHQM5_005923 [Ranunculus cassubicifolius]